MKPPRKPPRFARPDDDEPDVVRVEEDPPDTDKIPLPLPGSRKLPDKVPVRFDLLKGRQPSYVELAASLATVQETLARVVGMQSDILATQRKMALQTDHIGVIVNQRFDVFHKELSMLRAVVTGDHAPRLGDVEKKVDKLTPQQKAKAAAMVTARFGAWGTGGLFFGGLALRALAKVYPEYGDLIEGVLGWVGL